MEGNLGLLQLGEGGLLEGLLGGLAGQGTSGLANNRGLLDSLLGKGGFLGGALGGLRW